MTSGLQLQTQSANMCNTSTGDFRMLSAARVEARSNFDQNRFISPSSIEAEQKMLEAKEVARILRQNVVQGEQVTGSENEEQRYRAYIHTRPERQSVEPVYFLARLLRLHCLCLHDASVQSYESTRKPSGAATTHSNRDQTWRRLQQDCVVDNDDPWICFGRSKRLQFSEICET